MASHAQVEKDYIELQPQSVVVRLSALLSSGHHSDVTFLVGSGGNVKTFKAHKLILSTASDVFDAMFFGALAEKSLIEVPDLEPQGFEYMLKYVYGDKIDFASSELAISALCVAHKYLLEHFKLCCCNYLMANITPDTACRLYETACLYEVYHLQTRALYELIINTEVVISCESFLCALPTTIQMLLRQDNLEISSEAKLFNCILKWANSRVMNKVKDTVPVTVGDVMNPLLPYIRFLNMTAQEFTEGPAKSGAITNEEVLCLLMNIISEGSKPLPQWCCDKPPRGSPLERKEIGSVSCSNYLRHILPLCEARYVECKLTVKKNNAIILGIGFAAKWRDYTRYVEYETTDDDEVDDYEYDEDHYANNDYYSKEHQPLPFQGNLSFMKVGRNSHWLHSTVTCVNDLAGECSALFETPQLINEGETCIFRIDFGANTTVGRCTGAFAKDVKSTTGVEFVIESKELFVTEVSHIHKIYYWCFE